VYGLQSLSVKLDDGTVLLARLIGADPIFDVALIQLPKPERGKLPTVKLGDSDKARPGEEIIAIGNPLGLDQTVTRGIISGINRILPDTPLSLTEPLIQIDAPINPGNSGGPLLDKFGRMIGINSQILSPSGASVGVGFAVPVNTAKRVIPQLIQFGEVKRPKIGASLPSVEDLTRRGYRLPIDYGLLVYQLVPGGSAQTAGLHGMDTQGGIGDIILSAEGTKFTDLDDLYRLLDRKKIGDTVNFEVYRDGRTVTVPIRLLASPSTSNITRRSVQDE